MKLTATMSAVAIPALLAMPMFSNICGNLRQCSKLLRYLFVKAAKIRTYQNGPMNPQICLTNVMKTPMLAASSG